MTEKQRLLAVLAGQTPDRVPWFADLGHWFRAESGGIWNVFAIDNCTEQMADLHREVQAGWYIEVGSLHDEYYDEGVRREREIIGDHAIERIITPIGELMMTRIWNQASCSWAIVKTMVQNTEDLDILQYAVEHRHYRPQYERWKKIESIGRNIGLGFPSLGYTGLGSLISYYMGVENTVYMMSDEPERFKRYIDTANKKHMELVQIYSCSPAPHLLFTDNLSSDVQPPSMFRAYSLGHYTELARCLHTQGKTVSAHIDGRMNGLLPLLAEAKIDIADACTPKPSGDLEPADIRRQAGDRMAIMGGIAPCMWLPETKEKDFIEHVRKWLDLRKASPRLIQSAGDQVPPGAKLQRIRLVHDLVEEFGRY